MTTEVNWPLGNGHVLAFSVYAANQGWNNVPGLYIFSFVVNDKWYALYVGQAESFHSRLPYHERLNEAVQKGATHIHALVVPSKQNRDLWEQMLIQNLQPPMNTQLR